MNEDHKLPQWAPRVKKPWIRQLYKMDARGIHDEEFIDKVAYALLARCEAFLHAIDARNGNVHCPICSNVVKRHNHRSKEEIMHCTCSWSLSWGEYFKTIQHKQLWGAEPVQDLFLEFIQEYPKAKKSAEKMYRIDRLIHGFHYFLTENNHPTRPVAVNLIIGRLPDVIDFLDELSYSDLSTPRLSDQYQDWYRKSQYARSWQNQDGKTHAEAKAEQEKREE
ncbi:MAG: hypothetical protein K8R40_05495 [Anaerolineaceae bacterium]|nr:hypothetical protein [Anaerolineaceae bacterium]